MKVGNLVIMIEDQKFKLSEIKVKLIKLLFLNGKKLSPSASENFNSAIDALSDMNIAVHKRLDFKLKKVKYNDDSPLFKKDPLFNINHKPDTHLSHIISSLNTMSDVIVKFAAKDGNEDYNNIVNHRTMKKFKMTPSYFKAQKVAQNSVSSIIRSLNRISL